MTITAVLLDSELSSPVVGISPGGMGVAAVVAAGVTVSVAVTVTVAEMGGSAVTVGVAVVVGTTGAVSSGVAAAPPVTVKLLHQ